jgi:hypothetical protein
MKVMLYEIIFMSNSQDPFSSLLFHQTVYLKCVQTYFYLGEFEREIGRARDMRGRWEVGREEGGRRENALHGFNHVEVALYKTWKTLLMNVYLI